MFESITVANITEQQTKMLDYLLLMHPAKKSIRLAALCGKPVDRIDEYDLSNIVELAKQIQEENVLSHVRSLGFKYKKLPADGTCLFHGMAAASGGISGPKMPKKGDQPHAPERGALLFPG